jgi:hypothetical protein
MLALRIKLISFLMHSILVIEREEVHWNLLELFITIINLMALFNLLSKIRRQSLLLTIEDILFAGGCIVELLTDLANNVEFVFFLLNLIREDWIFHRCSLFYKVLSVVAKNVQVFIHVFAADLHSFRVLAFHKVVKFTRLAHFVLQVNCVWVCFGDDVATLLASRSKDRSVMATLRELGNRVAHWWGSVSYFVFKFLATHWNTSHVEFVVSEIRAAGGAWHLVHLTRSHQVVEEHLTTSEFKESDTHAKLDEVFLFNCCADGIQDLLQNIR